MDIINRYFPGLRKSENIAFSVLNQKIEILRRGEEGDIETDARWTMIEQAVASNIKSQHSECEIVYMEFSPMIFYKLILFYVFFDKSNNEKIYLFIQ